MHGRRFFSHPYPLPLTPLFPFLLPLLLSSPYSFLFPILSLPNHRWLHTPQHRQAKQLPNYQLWPSPWHWQFENCDPKILLTTAISGRHPALATLARPSAKPSAGDIRNRLRLHAPQRSQMHTSQTTDEERVLSIGSLGYGRDGWEERERTGNRDGGKQGAREDTERAGERRVSCWPCSLRRSR